MDGCERVDAVSKETSFDISARDSTIAGQSE